MLILLLKGLMVSIAFDTGFQGVPQSIKMENIIGYASSCYFLCYQIINTQFFNKLCGFFYAMLEREILSIRSEFYS